MALDLGLNLQTHATVTAVERESSSHWKVITDSVEVKTPKVIHATNGYSSYLLPELTGRVVPLKGHVAAIPPPPEFEAKSLDRTMAFIWDSDYDYLIQRQVGGKHLILGGGDLEHPEGLIGPLGDSDDSVMNQEIAIGLKQFPENVFEGWPRPEDGNQKVDDPKNTSETKVWTGIMGISKDCLPFLGELPSKDGQYIAARYHGHGT
jgi:glycine/D-amino acid oxidase-like deaminating enzyme